MAETTFILKEAAEKCQEATNSSLTTILRDGSTSRNMYLISGFLLVRFKRLQCSPTSNARYEIILSYTVAKFITTENKNYICVLTLATLYVYLCPSPPREEQFSKQTYLTCMDTSV